MKKLFLTAAIGAMSMSALASEPVTTMSADDLQATFKKADTNGDGYLSRPEATAAKWAAAKFTSADTNKDDRLDMSEFDTASK